MVQGRQHFNCVNGVYTQAKGDVSKQMESPTKNQWLKTQQGCQGATVNI